MVFRECGCRTYMTDHPNLFVPMVEYCSIHAAAPDMLTMLKATHNKLEGFDFSTLCLDGLLGIANITHDIAKEIAKAEGGK